MGWMGWCILGVVGTANVYFGRVIGLWGFPAKYVGKRSPLLMLLFGSVELCGILFFLWNQRERAFPFDLAHALFLSACVGLSYFFFRRLYAQLLGLRPPVPHHEYFNNQIRTILTVMLRQSGQASAQEALSDRSEQPGFHFDKQDYDMLGAMWGSDGGRLRLGNLTRFTTNGKVDYDRACAAEIVGLATAIPRFIEEMGECYEEMAELAPIGGLDRLDKIGLKQVLHFAEVLKEQWG